jgi:hypothetical protein
MATAGGTCNNYWLSTINTYFSVCHINELPARETFLNPLFKHSQNNLTKLIKYFSPSLRRVCKFCTIFYYRRRNSRPLVNVNAPTVKFVLFKQWVPNLHPARLCYAARGHVCKLCTYMQQKNYTSIYALMYTTYYDFYTCGLRSSLQSRVWPLAKKGWTPIV